MVIGASSREAIAFATANRSPDGSPPSDSCSSTPTSPSASRERSIAARCAHGRPAAQAEQRDPGRVGRGADLGRQRAPARAGPARRRRSPAELAQQRDDLVRVVDADAEHQRVAGQHRRVDRVVDDDAADVVGAVGVAVDQVQQGGAEVVEDPAEAGARARVGTEVMACSTLRR